MTIKGERPNHIEDYLITVRNGQWFGFSDYTNKIYANLIVHDGGSKPTEKQCTDGLKALQDAWDAANGGQMAYIGQGIKQGTFKVLDTSGNTYNGSNTTFSLGTQVGAAAQLLVSHDGVIQLPGTDYTLASGGASITFSTAPASGASIFITEISGAVGGTVTPSDTSVTADKLNSAILTGQTDIGGAIADADLFFLLI